MHVGNSVELWLQIVSDAHCEQRVPASPSVYRVELYRVPTRVFRFRPTRACVCVLPERLVYVLSDYVRVHVPSVWCSFMFVIH